MDEKPPAGKFFAKHTEVAVEVLPKCDFCDSQAAYDGKTKMAPWANMCAAHFKVYGIGLGLGRGQRLILNKQQQREEPAARVQTRPSKRCLLNDLFRTSLGLMGGGRVLITNGVDSLPEATKAKILLAVRDFSDFNEDNDPHGEHDFGSLKIAGHSIFWKIDYYDADYRCHGDVNRVLTIMLSHEY